MSNTKSPIGVIENFPLDKDAHMAIADVSLSDPECVFLPSDRVHIGSVEYIVLAANRHGKRNQMLAITLDGFTHSEIDTIPSRGSIILLCLRKYVEGSEPAMTLEKAIEIVEYHQVWRRGADIPFRDNSKDLGLAIDMVLQAARNELKIQLFESSDKPLIQEEITHPNFNQVMGFEPN